MEGEEPDDPEDERAEQDAHGPGRQIALEPPRSAPNRRCSPRRTTRRRVRRRTSTRARSAARRSRSRRRARRHRSRRSEARRHPLADERAATASGNVPSSPSPTSMRMRRSFGTTMTSTPFLARLPELPGPKARVATKSSMLSPPGGERQHHHLVRRLLLVRLGHRPRRSRACAEVSRLVDHASGEVGNLGDQRRRGERRKRQPREQAHHDRAPPAYPALLDRAIRRAHCQYRLTRAGQGSVPARLRAPAARLDPPVDRRPRAGGDRVHHRLQSSGPTRPANPASGCTTTTRSKRPSRHQHGRPRCRVSNRLFSRAPRRSPAPRPARGCYARSGARTREDLREQCVRGADREIASTASIRPALHAGRTDSTPTTARARAPPRARTPSSESGTRVAAA